MSNIEEFSKDIEDIRGILHHLIQEVQYDLQDSYIQSVARIINSDIVEYEKLDKRKIIKQNKL